MKTRGHERVKQGRKQLRNYAAQRKRDANDTKEKTRTIGSKLAFASSTNIEAKLHSATLARQLFPADFKHLQGQTVTSIQAGINKTGMKNRSRKQRRKKILDCKNLPIV